MSKHTPGPWVTYRGTTWYRDGGVPCKWTLIRPVVNGRVMSISLARCDNEANARLIAAAPEMLEMLMELVGIEGAQPGTQEWAKKTLAVIAKATGVEK